MITALLLCQLAFDMPRVCVRPVVRTTRERSLGAAPAQFFRANDRYNSY